jgi:DHA1 family bicyclomycin/chloramphenicol resistance-like MFS transporter
MGAPAQSSSDSASPPALSRPRPSPRPSLGILIAVTALGPMALNIFIPSMPGMTAVFGTDYGTIQLTLTLYLFGVAFAQLAMGPLSDRFGRRPVLLAGIALFLVGSLGAALAGTIETLIAARIVQAVGGCAGLVLGRAIVRDTHSREESASMIGYITMAMLVAPMLAPLVGGYLDHWFGWRSTFFAVLAVGAVVLTLAWLLLHETHHDRRIGEGPLAMLRGFGVLLRDAAFAGYALNVSFTTAVFFAFLAGAPYIMIELMQRPSSEYGLYFMMNAFSYMAGNFASGRFATRIGPDRMIFTGSMLALAGVALLTALALGTSMIPLFLFGPVMLVGIANGLSLPSAIASAISLRPDLAGTASGLVGFLQMMVGALATLLVGKLQDDTAFPMAAVMSAAAIIAFLGYCLARAALALRAAAVPSPGDD